MPASTKCKVSNFDSKTSKINGIENLRVDLIFETVTDARRSSLHRSSTRNQDSMELASAASLLPVLSTPQLNFPDVLAKMRVVLHGAWIRYIVCDGLVIDSPNEAQ